MGVLFDIAAAHLGDGNDNLALLRRAGRASLRDPHRRIRLVLLPLHYHPRPRRHLDRTISPVCFFLFLLFCLRLNLVIGFDRVVRFVIEFD